MQTPWEQRFAQRTHHMKSSAIRELLKLTENPEVISFAGGLPAPEVFPVSEFAAACDRVLRERGAMALQYSTTEGYPPLREMLARLSSTPGFEISPDNILITSGSQQALDLLGKILVNSGDHILTESPTYLGALQAWNAYGAEYVSVRSDNDGMVTAELESCMRYGPKMIYAMPTFQNPTGTTMSLERRNQLVEVADRYGVPIVEDDPYGQLRFEGDALPTVLAVDGQKRANPGSYNGNVIYLSTFSKILAPGMRLAWVVAPEVVIRKLVQAKQGTDLHTSTFNQVVAYEASKDGFLQQYIAKIVACYRERRDVMLDTLDEFMPKSVQWTHPHGGLFLWITLPEGLNSISIFKEAIAEKVAFVPGESFYANGGGDRTMRLNFSNSNPKLIAVGIERLARVIRRSLG